MEITSNCTIDNRDIEYIISCALEGGINYWCDRATVGALPEGVSRDDFEYASDALSVDGEILLREDEDQEIHILNRKNFAEGLTLTCKNFDRSPEDIVENHDAEIADCIIQFAIFGKLKYG